MSDHGSRIGGSFAERLTQLFETVREAGAQETLGAVRSLGQELGSDGVDGFIGSFHSIGGEEQAFLKNLFDGRVGDPDAAAAGAKSLLTREIEGQLQRKRLEVHVQDDTGRSPEAADASAAGRSRLVTGEQRLGINPQPEPPGDFAPLERAAAGAAHRLAVESEKRALGPQPEPPDNFIPVDLSSPGKIAPSRLSEMEKRDFDPQPEPPGISTHQVR
jgi:hypothetical protein